MKRDNVKQKELAELLEVHQTQISKYRKGENFPDVDKWEKIAAKFKVSPVFLVDDSTGMDEEIQAASLYRQRVQTLRELLRKTEEKEEASKVDRDVQDKLLDLRESQLSKLSMRI